MAPEPGANFTVDIEPFDPVRHDRTVFSCGSDRVDNYLKRTAKKHQKDDFALSEEIGLTVVILDVLEDGGAEETARRRRFYERLGFRSMPSRPTRMYFSIKNIRAALED